MSRFMPSILSALTLLFAMNCFAQIKSAPEPAFFTKAEISPSYPGGEAAWDQYLLKNQKKDTPLKRNAPDGEYPVVVKFLVEKNGNLSDIKPLTNYGYGMEEEAVRLIKESRKWVPASQNGLIVRCYHKQLVLFRKFDSNKSYGFVSVPKNPGSRGEDLPASVKIYAANEVDIPADYPGGIESWYSFLQKNLNNNIPLQKGAKPGKYEVLVEFAVNAIGQISNIKALTNHGYGMEDEAIRIIKTSGKWKPAILNNKEVISYRQKQLFFNIEAASTSSL